VTAKVFDQDWLSNYIRAALDAVSVEIEIGLERKVADELMKRGWLCIPPGELG